MRRLLAGAAVALMTVSSALAGGLRDLEDAWLVPAPVTAAILGPRTTSAPTWTVAVSQGHLFGLADLPQLGLTAGRRWGRAAGALRWESLGRSLYREDLARLEVLLGDRWRMGGVVGLDRLALAGGDPRTYPSGELRIQGPLSPSLRLDVWWPLTAAPPWFGRQGLRRWIRLVGVGDGWVWSMAIDRLTTGAPVAQGEILLRLAPKAAVGLRVEPWSGSVGITTAWRLGSLLLRSSHLVHPELGAMHRWSLCLGAGP